MRSLVRWGVLAGLPALAAGCVGAPVSYGGYGPGMAPGYGSAYAGGRLPPAGYYEPDQYPSTASAKPAARAVARTRPRPVAPAASPPDGFAAKLPDAPATPAAVAAAAPECRSVTELTYVDGKEVRQEQRYCRTPPNREWIKS